MILKELFRKHVAVATLPGTARISDAAEMMRREDVGSVVIVKGDRVAGILTDRDIALALALGAATPESDVSEVMTRDVETVTETISLFDLTRTFRNSKVKRLPVTTAEGKLVGLVALDDVLAILSREIFDACGALEKKVGHAV